jgi:3-hydroxyacyl-[acyl-carrier-protein] dehydratase
VTRQTVRLSFAKDHPTGPGHFPGNPMIPGALLLDAVIAAIAGESRDAPMRIRSAKFLRSVRPGEDLDINWRTLPDGSIKFECRLDEALAVTGAFAYQTAA